MLAVKKEGRILAICNTPFQVIVATCIKYHFYMNNDFDIALSDHFNDYKKFAENATATGLFRNVYTIDSREYCFSLGKYVRPKKRIGKLKEYFSHTSMVKRLFSGRLEYDTILGFNVDRFFLIFYESQRKKNPNVDVKIFEEGIGNYKKLTTWTEKSRWRERHRGKIRKVLDGVLGRIEIYHSISSIYLFSPIFLNDETELEVIKIPKLDPECDELKAYLNKIFGYDNCADLYKEKVIFFEESYLEDGFIDDYMPIINKISEVVGKDNILVKSHPRSHYNGFAEAGYKTNTNKGIPWEIILLNNPDLKNKVFVSFCSGSVVSPVCYFDMKIPTVCIAKMMRFRPNKEISSYMEYMRETVLKKFPDVFFEPRNENELKEYWERIVRNTPAIPQESNILPTASTEKKPKISVILCIYNGADVLETAIESIRSQTFSDWELVCINDGSTDTTLEVLNTISLSDSRIKVISLDNNSGLFWARCIGIANAIGDYIMFLDADDTYEQYALLELYEKIEHRKVDVLHYACRIIPETKNERGHVASTEKWYRPYYGRLYGKDIFDTCFIQNKIARSVCVKIFKASICKKAIENIQKDHILFVDDSYLSFLILFYAGTYYGDKGKKYYNYCYSPDIYIHTEMPKGKFLQICKWCGLVRERTKEFLEREGCFEEYYEGWASLNNKVLLRQLMHIWMYRLQTPEDRAECAPQILQYWNGAEIMEYMRKEIGERHWKLVLVKRSYAYQLGVKITDIPKKIRNRFSKSFIYRCYKKVSASL